MSVKGLLALLVSVWLATAGYAFAEDKPAPAKQPDPGLKDILTDLLEKLEEPPPPPAPPGRRLPFGRTEIQLSFAPLVRDTAPAVVNVYASQQVKARSPFDGDPFFERFFGQTPKRSR